MNIETLILLITVGFNAGGTVGALILSYLRWREAREHNKIHRQRDLGIDEHRIKLVYLAGAINKMSDKDCVDWRREATLKLQQIDFDTLDPMRRDYRGKEDSAYREIVEKDKDDIDLADVVLVNYLKPSVGTSMEILYAWKQKKPIILFTTEKHVSPWLTFHCSKIVKTLDVAIKEIQRLTLKIRFNVKTEVAWGIVSSILLVYSIVTWDWLWAFVNIGFLGFNLLRLWRERK